MLKYSLILLCLCSLVGCVDTTIERKPVESKQQQLLFHLERASQYGTSATNLARESNKMFKEYSISNRSETLQLAKQLSKQAEVMHQQEFSHTISAETIFRSLKFVYPKDVVAEP